MLVSDISKNPFLISYRTIHQSVKGSFGEQFHYFSFVLRS